MYIPNDDTQNYPFFRLKLVVETFGHSLNELTNQNLIKVVDPTDKKMILQNFGD